MDLNGKNVIYLGGFGGIGQKCLAEFLSKGVKNLAVFDLQENTSILQQLQKSYSGANVFFIKLDITNKDNIKSAYKQAVDKIGHIDVVVNGCGLLNDQQIDLTININLLGLIHSTLTAISYMDKSAGGRGGVIVNISSVAGIEPTAMLAVYSASKFGVTAFTRSLSSPFYFERTGIAYITICPGCTDTMLLDNPHEKSTFSYAAPLAEVLNKAKRQTPDVCAKNLVKTVELAKNGAVYKLDLGEIEEVNFPVFWKATF